jgi:hypothetical protein
MSNATHFVAPIIHNHTQRCLTKLRTYKDSAYAISMGIVHGNHFEHSVRFRNFLAYDKLDLTYLRFFSVCWTSFSDYGDLHICLNLEILFLEENFQPVHYCQD